MAHQHTPINQPRRNAGTRHEEHAGRPLRRPQPRTTGDATGINVDDRAPIDPRMPQMPPA